MALTASDTFTDADGTLLQDHTLDTGQTWTVVGTSGSGGIVIANDGADSVAAAPGDSHSASTVAWVNVWHSSGSIDVAVKCEGGASAGIAFRFSDLDNFWLWQVDVTAGAFELWKCQGGEYELVLAVADGTIAPDQWRQLRVEMSGPTITCWAEIDGVLENLGSVSSAFNATATRHGLYRGGADPGAPNYWDDYACHSAEMGLQQLAQYHLGQQGGDMIWLRQSTADQVVVVGPYVSSADGVTLLNGLTLAAADFQLAKAGSTSLVAKDSGGGVSLSYGGLYRITLNATDTSAAGPLVVYSVVDGALPVRLACVVLPAVVYDALIAGSEALTTKISVGTGTGQLDLTGGQVKVQQGTAAGQITTSAGMVYVADKTGFALAQPFPTNFDALAIDGSGRVQVQQGTAAGQITTSAGMVYVGGQVSLSPSGLDGVVLWAGAGGTITARQGLAGVVATQLGAVTLDLSAGKVYISSPADPDTVVVTANGDSAGQRTGVVYSLP